MIMFHHGNHQGLSAKNIKPPSTSDNSLTPALSSYGTETRVTLCGSCLQQPKVSYTHRKVVDIYIVYELGVSSSHSDDPKFFVWHSYFD